MKNICFESYRQSKRDNVQQQLAKPKPKQLHPSWYTDNIYSNRSEDLEEDYVPDCIKYGTYRKLRNICEQDEFYGEESVELGSDVAGGSGMPPKGRRGEGEGSAGYSLHRSTSCKDFHYPIKSQSCCFEGEVLYESEAVPPPATIAPATGSILKNRTHVPKSYSFSATTSKTTPFDVMDYELPPSGTTRQRVSKQEALRKSALGYYCSNSLDETALLHEPSVRGDMHHPCCAREHCLNVKCLLDDIYPSYGAGPGAGAHQSWRRGATTPLAVDVYGAGASGGSNRSLHATTTAAADWSDERGGGRRVAAATHYAPPPPQPTLICCCAADDYCYHRQQQHHIAKQRARLHCPGHHPAAEEEEHMHCRAAAVYDTDLEHFIRDERERLLLQDKFLDEDERYLSNADPSRLHYAGSGSGSGYRCPARHKSLLEVQPPSRYDEDTCSDSTEMDLEDFNIDLEKYWEELEKPPSPIDLDMQRRNMRSNLKVKNVNVGCYNNGQPIDLHDREQERMMIKKSLLEGMPSPPQADGRTSMDDPSHVTSEFSFFEHAASPLHRNSAFNYGHKVYPAVDTLPSYKYNNFYPEHAVQTQQPTAGGHHPSASGHSALSLINNIFSIYKPNKYSPHNCQMNVGVKPEPCKKMNVPSTRRPLGAPHSEYMHSMKRPLIVSTEQPHFKIIPEKTGLKISPLYNFEDYGEKPSARHKLTSTARPLMLPH